MKKIMIAAAIVCAAAFAQASAFNWSTSSMGKVYEAGSSSKLFSGTAYLFASQAAATTAILTQTDLLNNGLDTSKAVATAEFVDGVVSPSPKSFSFGADGDANKFYMVLVDTTTGNMFVSTSVNGAGQQGKTTSVTPAGTNSKLAATEWKSGSTFSTAGWYSTVPEPTSGLLLLIGMAGLALRRRRA